MGLAICQLRRKDGKFRQWSNDRSQQAVFYNSGLRRDKDPE